MLQRRPDLAVGQWLPSRAVRRAMEAQPRGVAVTAEWRSGDTAVRQTDAVRLHYSSH